MKKIWNYLKVHLREDLNIGHYLLVIVALGFSVYLNYTYKFHRYFLSQQVGGFKLLCYFIFYAVPYLFTVASYTLFYKKAAFLKEKRFWIKSMLVLACLALDNSLPFFRDWINESFADGIQFWVYKVSNNLLSIFTILLPLFLFYHFFDKKDGYCYGLRPKSFDVKPYFIMLLLMLPLIATASFHISFLNQYPMYKSSEAHLYLGIPEWINAFIYELSYGFDFVSIEFLFRGFMVIGLLSFMGRGSVLAMASVYCFLHFWKARR